MFFIRVKFFIRKNEKFTRTNKILFVRIIFWCCEYSPKQQKSSRFCQNVREYSQVVSTTRETLRRFFDGVNVVTGPLTVLRLKVN